MSQKQSVLNHLRSGVVLTQARALFELNVWRLADVIWKLKRDGHNIVTEDVKLKSGKRFAQYRLLES